MACKCKEEGCEELVNKRSYCSKHLKTSPEKREYQAKWRAARREQDLASKRAYRMSEKGKENARNYWATPVCRYNQLRKSQRKRGVELKLTLEEFIQIIAENKCDYCGGTLPIKGSGMDRLDSTKGYELGNVVPCCSFCNRLKADLLTHSETKAIVSLLKTLRNKDNIWEGFKWGGAIASNNADLVNLLEKKVEEQ